MSVRLHNQALGPQATRADRKVFRATPSRERIPSTQDYPSRHHTFLSLCRLWERCDCKDYLRRVRIVYVCVGWRSEGAWIGAIVRSRSRQNGRGKRDLERRGSALRAGYVTSEVWSVLGFLCSVSLQFAYISASSYITNIIFSGQRKAAHHLGTA